MTHPARKIQSTLLFVAVVFATQVQFTYADIIFDFSPEPADYTEESGSFNHSGFLTRDGVSVNLTAHSDASLFSILGKIFLSNQGIGISIEDAANNDAFQIDLASSDTFGDVNERLLLSFSQSVELTGISLQGLSEGSQAAIILDPETAQNVTDTLTGSSNLIDTYTTSIMLAANEQVGIGYVSGSGFRVDSFSVRAVPEPSGIILCTFTFFSFCVRRKRS